MGLATRLIFALAAMTAVPFGSLQAADYDPPIAIDQPAEVPVEVGSGWYLRGDIGYVLSSSSGDFDYRTFDPILGYGSASFDTVDVQKPFTYGVGFGYHFNDLFRTDFTVDGMRARFNGTTSSTDPCPGFPVGTTCRSEDHSEMSAISLMLNGYVDLGTVSGFTPYIGAGAGYSYVSWDNLENNLFCVGVCGPSTDAGTFEHNGLKDWRFTWQAMAGVAYAITDYLKIDVGYRYRQINGGDMFDFDAASIAAGATGVQGTDGKLQQHEVRVGLRYDLW